MATKGSFDGGNNMGTFHFIRRFLNGTYFFDVLSLALLFPFLNMMNF